MLTRFRNIKKINLVRLFNLSKIERQMIYLLALTIFLGVNFLLSPLALRLDLSFGKAYTLSPATKKILHNLDDIINIKFFVSSDLPTRLTPLKNDVTDFLNEFKKESRGKIEVKVLDPRKDEKTLNEAREIGIPEIQFSQLEKDRYAVTASYFGIALVYGDKKGIIPQVTELESLEYNLASSIYKLTNEKLPQIGIIGRENIFDPREDELFSFKKIMSQQFDLQFINFDENVKEINPSYKAIVVFDNGIKEYTQEEAAAIRKYIDGGGKAVFFVDGVWVKDNLSVESSRSNLLSFLAEYGINVKNNLILSTASEMVNFGNETVSFFAPYPFWLRASRFSDQVSYFSNTKQLTYPWVSSLEVTKKNGWETKELVFTGKNSWQQTENFVLNPQEIPEPKTEELKSFTLAAQTKSKNGGEIIVVPSSRFVLERYLSQSSGNLEFVLNVLNDLASDGALSGIRQRAIAIYPLPDIPETQKDIFRYTNIFLLPSLLAVYGVIRVTRRK